MLVYISEAVGSGSLPKRPQKAIQLKKAIIKTRSMFDRSAYSFAMKNTERWQRLYKTLASFAPVKLH